MSGLKGYPGYLSDFPRGTTVPIKFSLVDDDVVIDVTSGKVYVGFSTTLPGTAPLDLEVEIDPLVAASGTFGGEITGTQSLTLTAGKTYYSIKFIDANDKPYTIDYGKIKILPAVNVRIAQ